MLITAKKSAFKVLQQLQAEGSFDAAFAHHALHHVSDLEALFTFVRRAIGPDGVFLIADMIGRNGHRRCGLKPSGSRSRCSPSCPPCSLPLRATLF